MKFKGVLTALLVILPVIFPITPVLAASGDAMAGFTKAMLAERSLVEAGLCKKDVASLTKAKNWNFDAIYKYWLDFGNSTMDESVKKVIAYHGEYVDYYNKLQQEFKDGTLCVNSVQTSVHAPFQGAPKPLTQAQIDLILADQTAQLAEIAKQWDALQAKIALGDPACKQRDIDVEAAMTKASFAQNNYTIWTDSLSRGMSEQDTRMKNPDFTGPATKADVDAANQELQRLVDSQITACALTISFQKQEEDLRQKANTIGIAAPSPEQSAKCSSALDGFSTFVTNQSEILPNDEKIWHSFKEMQKFVNSMATQDYPAMSVFETAYQKSKKHYLDFAQGLTYFLGEGDQSLGIVPLVFCQSAVSQNEEFAKEVKLANKLLERLQADFQIMENSYPTFAAGIRASLKTSSSAIKGKQVVKSIVCSKGKLTKKVSSANPVCPKGYLKK